MPAEQGFACQQQHGYLLEGVSLVADALVLRNGCSKYSFSLQYFQRVAANKDPGIFSYIFTIKALPDLVI